MSGRDALGVDESSVLTKLIEHVCSLAVEWCFCACVLGAEVK